MIVVPSLEKEDAKRPGREREALVGERARVINRIKSTLAWLGIRGFKPHLRQAAAQLKDAADPRRDGGAGQYTGRTAVRDGSPAADCRADPRHRQRSCAA